MEETDWRQSRETKVAAAGRTEYWREENVGFAESPSSIQQSPGQDRHARDHTAGELATQED